MKYEGKTLCNFQLPNEVYEYLKKTSKDNYMSMTDYVIQMLVRDMKKELEKK